MIYQSNEVLENDVIKSSQGIKVSIPKKLNKYMNKY